MRLLSVIFSVIGIVTSLHVIRTISQSLNSAKPSVVFYHETTPEELERMKAIPHEESELMKHEGSLLRNAMSMFLLAFLTMGLLGSFMLFCPLLTPRNKVRLR